MGQNISDTARVASAPSKCRIVVGTDKVVDPFPHSLSFNEHLPPACICILSQHKNVILEGRSWDRRGKAPNNPSELANFSQNGWLPKHVMAREPLRL